jgi:hypothetical protein
LSGRRRMIRRPPLVGKALGGSTGHHLARRDLGSSGRFRSKFFTSPLPRSLRTVRAEQRACSLAHVSSVRLRALLGGGKRLAGPPPVRCSSNRLPSVALLAAHEHHADDGQGRCGTHGIPPPPAANFGTPAGGSAHAKLGGYAPGVLKPEPRLRTAARFGNGGTLLHGLARSRSNSRTAGSAG